MVIVLLVAGSLLMWGYSFANSNVQSQLAQQHIVFPALGSKELASPEIGPYLNQYAGQPLTTGAQAAAYANHFIAVHLSEMPLGGIYSQVSTASRADPTNAALAAEVQTSFQGTTLRGLLLEAYAFSEFGLIALYAGIAAFVLAATHGRPGRLRPVARPPDAGPKRSSPSPPRWTGCSSPPDPGTDR